DAVRSGHSAARERHSTETETSQQVVIRVESQRSTLATLRTSLDRASRQARQLEARRTELGQQPADGEALQSELERQLQSFLELRLAVERELGEARRAVEAADAQVRELDLARPKVEGGADSGGGGR